LTPEQGREYGRDGMAGFSFPAGVTYATVHKEKENDGVVAVNSRAAQGSLKQAERTLQESGRSRTIKTSFVERYHGARRRLNARKNRNKQLNRSFEQQHRPRQPGKAHL
jgi:hypothetical protein